VAGVVAGIILGYVGPVRGYFAQRSVLAAERGELQRLEARHGRLTRCLEALNDPVVLEMVARELGFARPGERVFYITGLRSPSPTGCASDGSGG
jgi:cell division protein FtsB